MYKQDQTWQADVGKYASKMELMTPLGAMTHGLI